jgi:hypothetical protein
LTRDGFDNGKRRIQDGGYVLLLTGTEATSMSDFGIVFTAIPAKGNHKVVIPRYNLD